MLRVTCYALVVLLLGGCARTVTPVVTYGNQMTVEVTLKGTMDINANRYFLVLASSSGFKVPLPPPDNITYEFLEPGTQPQQGSIEAYYANYYSTWSGYIMLEPAGYFLVKGPFVQGTEISREVIANLEDISTKITYNFSLNRLFGATIPNPIYFDFVSVSWPTGKAKFSQDHLLSTNAYIANIAGSTLTITDAEDDQIDPSLNILNCTVTIQ